MSIWSLKITLHKKVNLDSKPTSNTCPILLTSTISLSHLLSQNLKTFLIPNLTSDFCISYIPQSPSSVGHSTNYILVLFMSTATIFLQVLCISYLDHYHSLPPSFLVSMLVLLYYLFSSEQQQ